MSLCIEAFVTRVDLVYFNAGGGHRAAARALEAVFANQDRPWQVRLVHLFEVLDPQGQIRRLTGAEPEAMYNRRLASGWTLGLGQELKVLQAVIRLSHANLVERLQRHWALTEPDLVVSLVPNFNRALCESVATALPGVPFVTVMTDMVDHPPNFWIEPDQAQQHLVCGTARAMDQARAAGCAEHRLHRTSGMVMAPSFYDPRPSDRAAARASLGLDPDRPTGLVMFGGQGSKVMLDVAAQLEDIQLILMCGHNERLAGALKQRPARAPRWVQGFTTDVASFMAMADFFVGKPGPGSLSEAVHMGLPVVTVRNAWTMPQERGNVDWLQEQGLGQVGRSMRNIRPEVLQLLAQLPAFQHRVSKVCNRAVFEVPDILAEILRQSRVVVPLVRSTPRFAAT